MNREELQTLKILLKERDVRRSRTSLTSFTKFTFKKFELTQFHRTYYRILDLFADGDITKLMASCPPQVGKSEGSTRRMASHLLGRNPDLRIAIACYNATRARKFGREARRIMEEPDYRLIFDTKLATVREKNYAASAEEMEIPGHEGFMKAVGVGGGLSGDPVDVLLYDDLYKGYTEGNSPVMREKVWEWIIGVAFARLHNDSRQLMTFTRWHEDDVQGQLAKIFKVNEVRTWQDIEDVPKDEWVKINFEAIKTGEPTELDPRKPGESLWETRHSAKKYHEIKKADPHKFECVYQGNPDSKHGRLYLAEFNTYDNLPKNISPVHNMTDPADKGPDFVCSINYVECNETHNLYLVDMVFSSEPAPVTEPWVASMITRGQVSYARVESNGGGEGYCREVDRMTLSQCLMQPFYQKHNKEARIVSNAGAVNRRWYFPADWVSKWPQFYDQVTKFKRDFKANSHDDGPDCLTLVVMEHPEEEIYVG